MTSSLRGFLWHSESRIDPNPSSLQDSNPEKCGIRESRFGNVPNGCCLAVLLSCMLPAALCFGAWKRVTLRLHGAQPNRALGPVGNVFTIPARMCFPLCQRATMSKHHTGGQTLPCQRLFDSSLVSSNTRSSHFAFEFRGSGVEIANELPIV